jgi:hypothetical protein
MHPHGLALISLQGAPRIMQLLHIYSVLTQTGNMYSNLHLHQKAIKKVMPEKRFNNWKPLKKQRVYELLIIQTNSDSND